MDTSPDDNAQTLSGPVRALQWLVIGLTASLILGVLTVVVVIVIRFAGVTSPLLLPEDLVLPAGARPLSVTLGSDWLGVVTMDDEILIYDRQTGALRQTITLTRP